MGGLDPDRYLTPRLLGCEPSEFVMVEMLVKREYVRLRNFRAVWKGRGGGQELSAEVIRVPG